MDSQHEKILREWIANAQMLLELDTDSRLDDITRPIADRMEALNALLARNEALEDWLKGADHQPGCSGNYGRCKCGLKELRRELKDNANA